MTTKEGEMPERMSPLTDNQIDEIYNDPNFKKGAEGVEEALSKIEDQRREEEGWKEKGVVEKEKKENKEKAA